jgi:hypothetical protein
MRIECYLDNKQKAANTTNKIVLRLYMLRLSVFNVDVGVV